MAKKFLFSVSGTYHEQISPILSSNGSLDIALFIAHTSTPRRSTLQTVNPTKLTSRQKVNAELLVFALISQLMRCMMFGKALAGAYQTCSYTSQSEQRSCAKDIEIGFKSAVFTSFSKHQCHYCTMIEARTQRPLFGARENRQSTSYNFSFLGYYVQRCVMW